MTDIRKTEGPLPLTDKEKTMDVFDRAPCFNPFHLRTNDICKVCDRPTPMFPEWSGRCDDLQEKLKITLHPHVNQLAAAMKKGRLEGFDACVKYVPCSCAGPGHVDPCVFPKLLAERAGMEGK